MSSLATIRRWLTQHAKHGDVSQEFKRPRRPVRWVNRATHEHRWLRKPIAYIIGRKVIFHLARHTTILRMVFYFKGSDFDSSLGNRRMAAQDLYGNDFPAHLSKHAPPCYWFLFRYEMYFFLRKRMHWALPSWQFSYHFRRISQKHRHPTDWHRSKGNGPCCWKYTVASKANESWFCQPYANWSPNSGFIVREGCPNRIESAILQIDGNPNGCLDWKSAVHSDCGNKFASSLCKIVGVGPSTWWAVHRGHTYPQGNNFSRAWPIKALQDVDFGAWNWRGSSEKAIGAVYLGAFWGLCRAVLPYRLFRKDTHSCFTADLQPLKHGFIIGSSWFNFVPPRCNQMKKI